MRANVYKGDVGVVSGRIAIKCVCGNLLQFDIECEGDEVVEGFEDQCQAEGCGRLLQGRITCTFFAGKDK